MSTSTDKNANLPQTTPAQIDTLVRSALGAGDTGSTQAIHNVALVHQARLSQLKRTAAALKKQNGANNAATKAAEAAVKTGTMRVASMTAAHLQAATPRPEISSTGWALHGRVFNTQLQPLSNFTVFLVDDGKKFQRQFGFAYTDSTGYFLLNYAGAKSQPQTDGQLFLEIANKKSQPVYLSATQYQPVSGAATYQSIILPAGEKPLGDPPKEIRTGAFPKPSGKR